MKPGYRDKESANRSGGVRGVGSAYSHAMGDAGPYLFVGIQIAGAMVLFVLGGYFLDERFGTSPWLLLAGCLLGMVAVVASLFKAVQELEAHERRRRKGGSGAR